MKITLTCCLLLLLAGNSLLAQKKKPNKSWPNGARESITQISGAEAEIYKEVDGVKLKVFLFKPNTSIKATLLPAIIFFHGGGFTGGSPKQFQYQGDYFASRGIAAFSAEYRLKNTHDVTIGDQVKDAKSAIRWLRVNSKRLGIDPEKITVSGGSAGGHLAASAAIYVDKSFENKGEDLSVSAVPNALILYNPAIDLTTEGALRKLRGSKEELLKISPVKFIKSKLPPTLIMHGTADDTFPMSVMYEYKKKTGKYGGECKIIEFEGAKHSFFSARDTKDKKYRNNTTIYADQFLKSLGFIEGETVLKMR